MKKLKYLLLITLGAFTLTSCGDWLTVYPDNDQTSDQFWNTKEEVEGVLANGYISLRNCLEKIIVWGEVRGNTFNPVGSSNSDFVTLVRMQNMELTPTLTYVDWSQFYKIIKMANSVITYAPIAQENDESFYEQEMRSYMAEAYWLRSLTYFYLIRNFKDVPFVEEPYVKDDESYDIPKSSEYVIMNRILADLNENIQYAKDKFTETDELNPQHTKGRATRWAYLALMADIYLWKGDYAACLSAIEQLEESTSIGLRLPDYSFNTTEKVRYWFENFSVGNTTENIYEIQYTSNQTNSLLSWFNGNVRFRISSYGEINFSRYGVDPRGYGASYNLDDLRIIKYVQSEVGGDNRSTSDQNWIIYRYAEIMLMKAEALVLQGTTSYESIIENYIAPLRERVDAPSIVYAPISEYDMLQLILHERQCELFAEGKNWYDMLRIAKRNDWRYRTQIISEIIEAPSINAGNIAIVESKLRDTFAFYLPIADSEIKANRELEQNPYYRSIGY